MVPKSWSTRLRAPLQRLSWGLGDQAVSSMTNFVVGMIVARSLGATEFGVFSLAWVTYGVALNVSRGLATDPLVVRFSGVDDKPWRAAVARSAGTATVVGLATGVCCVLVGIALGGQLAPSFIALGIVLPGLLLQDAWRFAFFAHGQGGKAFANDMAWAVALVPALLLADRNPSVVGFLLAWGIAGGVAAVFGCVQTRIVPNVRAVRAWLTAQRDLGPRFLIENVSLSGTNQLWMYGLGAISGLAAVGAVRGAQLLLGPFLALLMGLSLVGVPEAARVLRRSPARLPMFCFLFGGVQLLAALAWGMAILFLLPDVAGRLVLGSVWLPALALIVPATVSTMSAGFTTGAAAGLRALGAARRSLRAQLLVSVVTVVGGLVGAVIAGALGSYWGVALANVFRIGVWWWQLRAALRERTASAAPGELSAVGAHAGSAEESSA
jgi:O-antigen/teichoic acid export membrane protein